MIGVGSYTTTTGAAYSVAVSGTLAYLAYGNLRVVNVANPASPAQVGSGDLGYSYATGVVVSGTLAYVPNFYGLILFDVSNPGQPVQVGVYDSHGYTPGGVAVRGSYVYLSEGDGGLVILRVTPLHYVYLPAVLRNFR